MIHIAKFPSNFGNIEVLREKDTGVFIYRQGGYYQSECDSDGVSTIPYVHAIFSLLKQMRAAEVLMIGCGGGNLGTMLDRAGAHVTIVDVNPTAFLIARRFFGLPSSIACCVADGQDFLHANHKRYDAIILDAYSAGHIPEHLCSHSFFELAQIRLKKSLGCLITNVCARRRLDTLPYRIAAKLLNVWADVRVLDAPGTPYRNALVMAGNVRELDMPVLLMPPAVGADDITRDLHRLKFTPWH
jgi:spermidine synthase